MVGEFVARRGRSIRTSIDRSVHERKSLTRDPRDFCYNNFAFLSSFLKSLCLHGSLIISMIFLFFSSFLKIGAYDLQLHIMCESVNCAFSHVQLWIVGSCR